MAKADNEHGDTIHALMAPLKTGWEGPALPQSYSKHLNQHTAAAKS